MAEPVRLSTLSALHSALGLPSLCAGGECIVGRSSQRRTTLAPYFAAPPVCSPPLFAIISSYFALDFAGILSVNGKKHRPWWLACLDKRIGERRMRVWKQDQHKAVQR